MKGRKECTNHIAIQWLRVAAVHVVVQSVKGLLELPGSLDLCSNFRAELTHFFLVGHPPHLISQAIHRGSHWIDKAILEELLLPGEPRIQSLAEWSH